MMGTVVSYLNGRGFIRDLANEYRSYYFTSADVIEGELEMGDTAEFEGGYTHDGPHAFSVRKLRRPT